ncbi:MAG TPA: MBG domain-containing protein [Candidatus Angelobacter sp.]|nr:MBG domain-containing protein [Candidatus Angelobacter sp.]
MDIVHVSTSLLSTGKRTCLKFTTIGLAMLLAMLAVPMAAPAQITSTTKPKLVVTPLNAARFYGDANPAFAGIVTGLAKGDTITVTYSSAATSTSAVGDYQIVATLNDPDHHLANYVVTVNTGTLSIAPAPLSIVADDLTRGQNQPNPATFTGTVTGVKNGEAITASFDSNAVSGSAPGAYPIVSTLKADATTLKNYAVTVSDGTLTITP